MKEKVSELSLGILSINRCYKAELEITAQSTVLRTAIPLVHPLQMPGEINTPRTS